MVRISGLGRRSLTAVADAQDMDFVADDFVTDDIGIDERPLAKVIADRSPLSRKILKTVAGFEKTRRDIARCPWIELADITTKALQVADR